MKTSRTFGVLGLVTVVMLLAGVSCAVPTSTPKTWQEVCIPSDWPGAQVVVTPLVVPDGAWVKGSFLATYGVPSDPGYDVIQYDTTWDQADLVVGQGLGVGGIDAGLCHHLSWSGGLHFTISTIPSPHLWGPTTGWPPGWTGPPAP